MNQRMMTVSQMDPFVGKYFSVEYVRKEILGQTNKEMKEIDKQMQGDIASGLAIDPAETNMLDTMSQQNTAFQPEISAQQADDAAERQELAADAASEREVDKAKKMPSPSASTK